MIWQWACSGLCFERLPAVCRSFVTKVEKLMLDSKQNLLAYSCIGNKLAVLLLDLDVHNSGAATAA